MSATPEAARAAKCNFCCHHFVLFLRRRRRLRHGAETNAYPWPSARVFAAMLDVHSHSLMHARTTLAHLSSRQYMFSGGRHSSPIQRRNAPAISALRVAHAGPSSKGRNQPVALHDDIESASCSCISGARSVLIYCFSTVGDLPELFAIVKSELIREQRHYGEHASFPRRRSLLANDITPIHALTEASRSTATRRRPTILMRNIYFIGANRLIKWRRWRASNEAHAFLTPESYRLMASL